VPECCENCFVSASFLIKNFHENGGAPESDRKEIISGPVVANGSHKKTCQV